MLEEYKSRLIEAGWSVEPGDSVLPAGVPHPGLNVLWMARKNGVTLVVCSDSVRIIRGNARSSTPMALVLGGQLLLPGSISERYLSDTVFQPGSLEPHEGPMAAEEAELRSLLRLG